jgi:ubiquinone/menaquinone biosynthesis C-methylase UbiE
MSFYQFFFKIYQREAERMCRECEEFIKKGSKILDLGCGSAIVAKTLKDFFEAEILGVDIEDKRVVNIPFQIIDGKNLPFKENEFDLVFISYVLHHAENPVKLLKEAKRVSKEKIIIFENLAENFLTKFLNLFHLFTFNLFFQKKQKINFANFKESKEWEKIFKNLGLKIIFKKRVFSSFDWLYPVKRIMFVLKKE